MGTQNLRIVSTNLATNATLSASSEAGSLVVENLLLDSKTEIWRSTSTTASVTATFSQTAVSCVTFPICNLTSTATMRVRVYTNSGDGSPALDTGNTLCCEYTTIDKIDFADGALNANTFSYGGGTYATLFFASTLGEKVVIDIVDSSNTNGYIECSSIVIGDYWSPNINVSYNASMSFLDTSKHSRNDSGDLKTNRGARYKKLSFTLGYLKTEDRVPLTEILIRNGMSAPIYLHMYPESSDIQENQLYQIYGRLSKLSSINRYNYNLDKNSIEIIEM